MTSEPAYIILRVIQGDMVAGPIEWDDGKIEYHFPLKPGQTITGFDVCHLDGTQLHHTDHYMRTTPDDKTYTVYLSVQKLTDAES